MNGHLLHITNLTGGEEFPYEDILDHPHHRSAVHPPMDKKDRAAQFAPFAALTGHKAVIREHARHTEQKQELNEDEKALLSRKLELLRSRIAERPWIRLRYFLADQRKEGGEYREAEGKAVRIDLMRKRLLLDDGSEIALDDLTQLEGELFAFLED